MKKSAMLALAAYASCTLNDLALIISDSEDVVYTLGNLDETATKEDIREALVGARKVLENVAFAHSDLDSVSIELEAAAYKSRKLAEAFGIER